MNSLSKQDDLSPALMSHLLRVTLNGISLACLQEVLNKGEGSQVIYQQLIDEIRNERQWNLTQWGLTGELVIFGVPQFAHYKEKDSQVFEQEISELIEYFRESLERDEATTSGDPWTDGLSEDEIKELDQISADIAKESIETYTRILEDYRDKGPERFWNEMELAYVQTCADLISLTREPYWKVHEQFRQTAKRFEEQPYLSHFATLLPREYNAEARTDAQLGLAELALTLKMRKAQRGTYPFSPEVLVPDILPELPKDPFTGRDYKYKRAGDVVTIYSVGENQQDDGAAPYQTVGWDGDYDIVWKLGP